MEGSDTSVNDQAAVAEGAGSLAINAAAYANVTVYQYITRDGGDVSARETSDPSTCPYPGLESFRTSETRFFAGRQDDIASLERKLAEHDICGVIAASGAGKSSLIHAGLVPALAERENEVWDVFAFKPGEKPLYELARSLSGVLVTDKDLDAQRKQIKGYAESLRDEPGVLLEYLEAVRQRRAESIAGKHHHILIFIDQWEELYTRENDDERDILVRELQDVAARGLAKILLTMRIDFMEEMLLLSTDFFRSLKPGIHYVEPMRESGLRSAIEDPAKVVRLGVPEILTQRLILDLGNGRDHGSLPYLQFVLRQLWEKRDQDTNSLTTEAYDKMKGLKGAIGDHADAVYRKLTKKEQGQAQRVLPRLANVSESGVTTSRRLPFADFNRPARKLLRKLAEPERRLIVLSSATQQVAEAEIVAEVAHEALLDDWGKLSGWIADRKEFFRLRNRLEADAKTWVENSRNPDFLIPAGKPLLDAQDLKKKHLPGDMSYDLSEFIVKSVSKRKKEERERFAKQIALRTAEAEKIRLEKERALERERLAKKLSKAEAQRADEAEKSEQSLKARNKWLMRLTAFFIAATIGAGYFWIQSLIAKEEAETSARTEALARFRSEVRLAGSLVTKGTSEAWKVLTVATRDYAETVGKLVALEAMDADVLTVALQALINQRVFQLETMQNQSSEIIGFSPDGSSLIVTQDGDLLLIDALSTRLRGRLADLGTPFLHWPIGGPRLGLIVCVNSPCLFQEALSAANTENQSRFWTSYVEYMGLEDHERSMGESDFWELVGDTSSHVREDIARGKIGVVILDATNAEAVTSLLMECGDQFCIGSPSGKSVLLDLAHAKLDEVKANLLNAKVEIPLRIVDGSYRLSAAEPVDLPPTFEIDVDFETTNHIIGLDGTIVRTNATSALIEIFSRDAEDDWKRSSSCLEYYEEEQSCAAGLVAARVLDISASGRQVLATSVNYGTGGGAGIQQTVLINAQTGEPIWRIGTVIRQGTFAADGSTFATIDWLGRLEIRSATDFDLIYRHAEPVRHSFEEPGLIYHPNLPEAVVMEQDGDIVLVDLTPSADLGKTTAPLPSMREMCREVDHGPFRTILSSTARPLNSFDWSWGNTSTKSPELNKLPIFADEALVARPAKTAPNGALIVELEDEKIEITDWGMLVADVAPELVEHDDLQSYFDVGSKKLAVWEYTQSDSDKHLESARWVILFDKNGVWSVGKTGVVKDPPGWTETIALAVSNEIYAMSHVDCSLKAFRLDTGEQLWSETLAFSLGVDLKLIPADGIAIAKSREWYDAVSVQIFDLRTGAPGPWVNIVEASFPDTPLSSNVNNENNEYETELTLRLPPWGDRLRRLLMDAAYDRQ